MQTNHEVIIMNPYIPDLILSREAQLIYLKSPGFEPHQGLLTTWKGMIPTVNGPIEVMIYLLEGFPAVPPKVKILTEVEHPNVMKNNELRLQILDRWRPNYHVYQVINDMTRLFNRVPPKIKSKIKIKESHIQETVTPQIITLKQMYDELVNEEKRLRQQVSSKGMPTPETKKELVENYLLKLDEDLYDLECQFNDGEIDSITYCKRYLSLKTKLLLLESINS